MCGPSRVTGHLPRNVDCTWCILAFLITKNSLFRFLGCIPNTFCNVLQDCMSGTSLRLAFALRIAGFSVGWALQECTPALFCQVVLFGPIQPPLMLRPRQLPVSPSLIAKIDRSIICPKHKMMSISIYCFGDGGVVAGPCRCFFLSLIHI